MKSDDHPRVIYIAGYGRSGSTILDITLGQHPAIFGAGEITTLARRVWTGNEYCACGDPIRECEIWSAIVRQWTKDQDASFIQRYGYLQGKFESITSPLSVMSEMAGKRDFEEYTHHTLRLYHAMASVSGNSTIIDSSKLPGRAFALSRMPGLDLHVIHLIRDVRAVAWSMLQRYDRDVRAGLQREIRPKSTVHTALRWGVINASTELLCRHLGPDRVTRVR